MGVFVNLSGLVFGRLKAVSFSHKDKYGLSHWECICDCGGKKIVRGSHLVNGLIKSCGCFLKDSFENRKKRPGLRSSLKAKRHHGLSYGDRRHYLYYTWQAMRRRCNSSSARNYKNYGGRGIKIFSEWDNFIKFKDYVEDNLGHKPIGMSLDRKDNNKGYFPGNLRWATPKQQNANTRLTYKFVRISKNGDKRIYNCVSDATEEGFHSQSIRLCVTGLQKKHKGYSWELLY